MLISIHALRKESDVPAANALGHSDISIHALRKESDARIAGVWRHVADFNPRSP